MPAGLPPPRSAYRLHVGRFSSCGADEHGDASGTNLGLGSAGLLGSSLKFIAEEENRAVLDTFLARTLGTLIWHGAAREAANLVLPLLDRFPIGDPRNGAARSHLIQMTLQFWLRFHFPTPRPKWNLGWRHQLTTRKKCANRCGGFGMPTLPASAGRMTKVARSINPKPSQ